MEAMCKVIAKIKTLMYLKFMIKFNSTLKQANILSKIENKKHISYVYKYCIYAYTARKFS